MATQNNRLVFTLCRDALKCQVGSKSTKRFYLESCARGRRFIVVQFICLVFPPAVEILNGSATDRQIYSIKSAPPFGSSQIYVYLLLS